MLKPLRLLVLVGGVVVSGALFGAIALSQDKQPDPHPPDPRPQVTALPPEIERAFHVLRSDPEALPPRVEARLAASTDDTSLLGVNAALARRTVSTADGGVYLVPGNGVACVVTVRGEAFGISCDDNARVAERGLWQAQAMQPGVEGRRIQGIAPDEIVSVRVTGTGHEPVDADVRNNGFSLDFPGETREISWMRSDGSIAHRDPLG